MKEIIGGIQVELKQQQGQMHNYRIMIRVLPLFPSLLIFPLLSTSPHVSQSLVAGGEEIARINQKRRQRRRAVLIAYTTWLFIIFFLLMYIPNNIDAIESSPRRMSTVTTKGIGRKNVEKKQKELQSSKDEQQHPSSKSSLSYSVSSPLDNTKIHNRKKSVKFFDNIRNGIHRRLQRVDDDDDDDHGDYEYDDYYNYEDKRNSDSNDIYENNSSIHHESILVGDCSTELIESSGDNIYRDEFSELIFALTTQKVLPQAVSLADHKGEEDGYDLIGISGIASKLRDELLDEETGKFRSEYRGYLPSFDSLPIELSSGYADLACRLVLDDDGSSSSFYSDSEEIDQELQEFCRHYSSGSSNNNVNNEDGGTAYDCSVGDMPRMTRIPTTALDEVDVAVLCMSVARRWDDIADIVVEHFQENGMEILDGIEESNTIYSTVSTIATDVPGDVPTTPTTTITGGSGSSSNTNTPVETVTTEIEPLEDAAATTTSEPLKNVAATSSVSTRIGNIDTGIGTSTTTRVGEGDDGVDHLNGNATDGFSLSPTKDEGSGDLKQSLNEFLPGDIPFQSSNTTTNITANMEHAYNDDDGNNKNVTLDEGTTYYSNSTSMPILDIEATTLAFTSPPTSSPTRQPRLSTSLTFVVRVNRNDYTDHAIKSAVRKEIHRLVDEELSNYKNENDDDGQQEYETSSSGSSSSTSWVSSSPHHDRRHRRVNQKSKNSGTRRVVVVDTEDVVGEPMNQNETDVKCNNSFGCNHAEYYDDNSVDHHHANIANSNNNDNNPNENYDEFFVKPSLRDVDVDVLVRVDCDPPEQEQQPEEEQIVCYLLTVSLLVRPGDAADDAEALMNRVQNAITKNQKDGAYFATSDDESVTRTIFVGLPEDRSSKQGEDGGGGGQQEEGFDDYEDIFTHYTQTRNNDKNRKNWTDNEARGSSDGGGSITELPQNNKVVDDEQVKVVESKINAFFGICMFVLLSVGIMGFAIIFYDNGQHDLRASQRRLKRRIMRRKKNRRLSSSHKEFPDRNRNGDEGEEEKDFYYEEEWPMFHATQKQFRDWVSAPVPMSIPTETTNGIKGNEYAIPAVYAAASSIHHTAAVADKESNNESFRMISRGESA